MRVNNIFLYYNGSYGADALALSGVLECGVGVIVKRVGLGREGGRDFHECRVWVIVERVGVRSTSERPWLLKAGKVGK